MKISKIRNVKTPTRGTIKSAGIDFYIPEFEQDFLMKLYDLNQNEIHKDIYKYLIANNTLYLAPHHRILIPSGIKVNIPEGYSLNVYNKSGVSTIRGLDRMAEVIDEDYQGEIHISLVNTSSYIVAIHPGEKIIQLLLQPIKYCSIEKVELLELYNERTDRAEGGFGSTE